MKITIRKPIGYTQIGRKDQQEDAVWPPFDKVTAESRCIVLCDGVGGSAHGEIASQTASKVIGEYLTSQVRQNGIVGEADVQEAVRLAYDELEKIDTGDSVDGQPSMATTLTCVCIHEEGILAAHMGDSRIYLVRPGQGLLYQSSDHSLVNALLQAGELTLEEAKNFPRKNVITKAIQPNAQKRFNAEVHQLTDVRSGDYIFMCCDGVLEQLTNERLVEILSMDCSDEKKLALLEAESTDRTKDNYTAYLIPIDKVEGKSTLVNEDEVAAIEVEQTTPAPEPPHPTPEGSTPPPIVVSDVDRKVSKVTHVKDHKVLFYIVGAVTLFIAFFYVGRSSSSWFDKSNPVDGAPDVNGLYEGSPNPDNYEKSDGSDYVSDPTPDIKENLPDDNVENESEQENVTPESQVEDTHTDAQVKPAETGESTASVPL